MTASPRDPRRTVRPLRRVRQTREFTDEPVDPDALEAIVDAARWTGSSQNTQPWRFITIRDLPTIRAIAATGLPSTRSLATAPAAIAIAMPEQQGRSISLAYDEGRAAERILIAASFCGLGAGIAWIHAKTRPTVAELLGLPPDRFVRTVAAIGHPTERGRRPKAPPGEARLPRDETVLPERWPD